MPLIEIETEIKADIQTCFDLARSIDFYQKSLKNSNETAIDGKTTGLVEANDSVTWEAKHFGFVRHLTLEVTEFVNPHVFVDEMVDGHYKTYKHEHIFCTLNTPSANSTENKTIMIDRFYFESSFVVLGKIIDSLFLKSYIKNLLKTRNGLLKQKAESL